MSIERHARQIIVPVAYEVALRGACPTCASTAYRLVAEACEGAGGTLLATSLMRRFSCGYEEQVDVDRIFAGRCLAQHMGARS